MVKDRSGTRFQGCRARPKPVLAKQLPLLVTLCDVARHIVEMVLF
ncbi:hypothetical protein NSERUTF1_6299 [Nocardia seriolae]|nr:hypothetical protein NSERUTF1_6299 [Nocardia seriolae]